MNVFVWSLSSSKFLPSGQGSGPAASLAPRQLAKARLLTPQEASSFPEMLDEPLGSPLQRDSISE